MGESMDAALSTCRLALFDFDGTLADSFACFVEVPSSAVADREPCLRATAHGRAHAPSVQRRATALLWRRQTRRL